MMLAGGAGSERMLRPRVHRKALAIEGRPTVRAARVVASRCVQVQGPATARKGSAVVHKYLWLLRPARNSVNSE
jgi:hypothetical protein